MKFLKILAIPLFIVVSFLPLAAQETPEPVKMWEENMTLPTYKTGEPDKSPLFYTPAEYQGAQRHIYPYSYIGDLSNDKVDVEYKGVFLENEYIKICVTPEMGGRLYYALDKTNDYNIVYYNHVVKPALIGMAGAWTSGGAEWNIPHHHRPTSFLPIDYSLVENPDGSKTVWVGEYEKRNQTRWLVGLTLEPGKAYVKTEFRYFNVTPLENTFLFWINTAVHANKDYQVIFPPDVEKAVFHAKTEFTNWPIANQKYQGIDFTKGQDISWWKNTSSPTSFFAWGTKQNFIAGIDHGKNAGTVKVGDRHVFPGKKFWNWGPNEVGQRWDEKLTDSDGPYLELMMGGYSDNQPDYSFINPMSAKKGTMFYYGIKNMNNIKAANSDFAINLEQNKTKALVQINATGVEQNVQVILTGKGKQLLKETIFMSPLEPYSKEIVVPNDIAYMDLKIQLFSEEGIGLIEWEPAPKKNEPHPEPYQNPKNPQDYETNDDLWLAGLRLEQFGNATFDAVKYYKEGLSRDSTDILINTQMGLSYLKKGMAEKAEEYLSVAVDKVTANHTKPKFNEPLYYLGLSLMNQGKLQEAKELLYKAAWDYEWTSPAYTLLAQIESLEGDWKRAYENIEKATVANPTNLEALNLKTMILRKNERFDEALKSANMTLKLDPLNFTTMNELLLLSKNASSEIDEKEKEKLLIEKLRDEPDSYLEVSSRYGNAGFFEEAINFLSLAIASKDPELNSSPMIRYHMGYYYGLKGDTQNALKMFVEASKKPIDYVFPYGETSEKALKASIDQNSGDANAYYFLGNIYADHQPEKAIKLWETAISLNNNVAIFYRNLAFAQANYTKNIEEAVENIMKAIKIDPSEPRYFAEADDYMAYARVEPEKIASFIDENVSKAAENAAIKSTQIRLNNFFGNYDEAISMLENTQFRTEEGATFNVHVFWFDAHLLKGIKKMNAGEYEAAENNFLKAMEFPANLESERNAKIGMSYYYLGLTNKLQGKKSKAKEYFTKMANYSYQRGWGAGSFPEIDYYKALANKALGKEAEKEEYLSTLMKEGDKGLGPEVQGQYSKSSNQHEGRVAPSFARKKSTLEAHANAYYSKGLAFLGQGKKEEATEMFQQALKMNPTHLGAKMHMSDDVRLGERN